MALLSSLRLFSARLSIAMSSALTSFRMGLIVLCIWSYNGPLHNYTLEPVQLLLDHQDDHVQLRVLLVKFRTNKEREMTFVQKAVSITHLHLQDHTDNPRPALLLLQ